MDVNNVWIHLLRKFLKQKCVENKLQAVIAVLMNGMHTGLQELKEMSLSVSLFIKLHELLETYCAHCSLIWTIKITTFILLFLENTCQIFEL